MRRESYQGFESLLHRVKTTIDLLKSEICVYEDIGDAVQALGGVLLEENKSDRDGYIQWHAIFDDVTIAMEFKLPTDEDDQVQLVFWYEENFKYEVEVESL